MKISGIKWEDDNNTRFVFEGEPEYWIDVSIKDLNKFRKTFPKEGGFINMSKYISINLNKVKYIIYKIKERKR